jgi:uncharacterized membrane protein YkvA (DUF1232 family)
MLFKLLDEMCRRVDLIDYNKDDLLAMSRQIESAQPALWKEMSAKTGGDGELFKVAALLLVMIKELPERIGRMRTKLTDPSTDPVTRAILATVLAYLVTPRDIIPDDLPGDYGLLDDVLLARVALFESTGELPKRGPEITRSGRDSEYCRRAISEEHMPVLKATVQGISTMAQAFRALPEDMLTLAVEQIIENPLQAAQAPPPPGLTPTPNSS